MTLNDIPALGLFSMSMVFPEGNSVLVASDQALPQDVEQKTAVCSFNLVSGSSNDLMWMFLPVSQNSAVLTLQFVQGMKGGSFCARMEGLPMGGMQW